MVHSKVVWPVYFSISHVVPTLCLLQLQNQVQVFHNTEIWHSFLQTPSWKHTGLFFHCRSDKTGLQPVSRPVKQILSFFKELKIYQKNKLALFTLQCMGIIFFWNFKLIIYHEKIFLTKNVHFLLVGVATKNSILMNFVFF